MLSAMGERPVTSLTTTSSTSALAERTLDYVNRRTQVAGRHFNTELDVPLTRDSNNHILLANVMMKVDVNPYVYNNIDPVFRGGKLYDVKNRTYVFSQDLKADIVYLLDFETIPETAREYITIKAARIFQDRYFSDMEMAGFTREEERDALRELRRDEGQQADLNIFDNYSSARILNRHGSGGPLFTHNSSSDRSYMSIAGTGDNSFFEIN